ncbi:NRPS/PKS hybrid [Ceratobasidium theobromae]|uniref:NRPS/PKS hybrid n=1 Tax=Ceratobasidium theobromae TaxID=1582974 RepID=A0A5N5QBZ7_9AGAM|nr:NRPS/PKS hybrid [Ceratobasidium theobromae]
MRLGLGQGGTTSDRRTVPPQTLPVTYDAVRCTPFHATDPFYLGVKLSFEVVWPASSRAAPPFPQLFIHPLGGDKLDTIGEDGELNEPTPIGVGTPQIVAERGLGGTTNGGWGNREEELLVSPDYFVQLARDDDRFDSAVTYLKRGVVITEMNLFRFDAILHSPQQKALSASVSPPHECSLSSYTPLNEFVPSIGSLPILLRNIPNARIADVHHISTVPLDGSQSLSDIPSLVKSSSGSSGACHPEDLILRLSTPGIRL